jgi:hypothetical protein
MFILLFFWPPLLFHFLPHLRIPFQTFSLRLLCSIYSSLQHDNTVQSTHNYPTLWSQPLYSEELLLRVRAAQTRVFIMAATSIRNFFCCRSRSKPLNSSFDPRYGAAEITAPNAGAYANARYQTSPTMQTFVKYNPRDYVPSEQSPGNDRPFSPNSRNDSVSGGSGSGSQPSSPPHSSTNMPVHAAYHSDPQHASIQSALSPSSSRPSSHPNSPPNSAPLPRSASSAQRSLSTGVGLPPSPGRGQGQARGNGHGRAGQAAPLDTRTAGTGRHWNKERKRDAENWSPESAHSVEQWPGSM